MQRWATLAVALAVAAAGAFTPVRAQESEEPANPGYLDLGVYTGGSYSSEWFTTEDAEGAREGWEPGYAPTFGAVAQIWIDPRFGVRLHGAYLPQNLPGAGGLDLRQRVVNSYVYDADLVVRPFVLSTPNTLLQTVYLFAGAGGYTANVGDAQAPGSPDGGCVPQPEWTAAEVCVSTDPEYSTNAMGVVGGGIRLARVTDNVEAFGEVAVHAYDSPAHVRDGGAAEDRLTWTPRAVIGLKASFGARRPSAPRPAPLPPPPPQPRVEPQPVTPPVVTPPPATQQIAVCAVRNGGLERVVVDFDPATGDSTVAGVPFSQAFPAESVNAPATQWFVSGEPVTFQGRRYVKFGLSRVLSAGDVEQAGEFRGVPVFAEPGVRTEVLYIPVGPGCEFQPYQLETKISAVRG